MVYDVLPQFMPLYQPNWDNIVVFSGRGAGRSVAATWIARRRKKRLLYVREYASSNDQSTKAQVEIVIDNMGINDEWHRANGELTHKKTGSIIFFRGLAINPNNVKSIPDIDWCTFEECEDAQEEHAEALRKTIRKEHSRMIWLGNPRLRSSYVAQLFIENEPPPRTCVIRNSYLDNPHLSQKAIREADHMKKTRPELYSHVFMGNYLDVGQCIMVQSVSYIAIKPVSPVDVCVFGVDIARDGGDKTVIAIRKGYNVIRVIPYDTMDLDTLVMTLKTLIYEHKPDYINVDSTGHGAWVPDALKSSGIKVTGINFASNARKKDVYANKRTELYGLVNEFFEAGGAIPRECRKLEDQLRASHYKLDADNRYQLLPKVEIKKMIGESPDESDAVGLCMVTPSGNIFQKSMIITSTAHEQQQRVKSAGWKSK